MVILEKKKLLKKPITIEMTREEIDEKVRKRGLSKNPNICNDPPPTTLP